MAGGARRVGPGNALAKQGACCPRVDREVDVVTRQMWWDSGSAAEATAQDEHGHRHGPDDPRPGIVHPVPHATPLESICSRGG